MKLRLLIVVLMVVSMANIAFADFTGPIYWDEDVVGNWSDTVGEFGDPAHWKREADPEEDPYSYVFPDGTMELKIFGTGSVVTVNSDVAYTSWYSNRARVFGGATVNIEAGGNLEGLGWLRVGEVSKPGVSTINQTGGMFKFENGPRLGDFSQGDYKDPAGLTLGDNGGLSAHGIFNMSGGTLTYVRNTATTGDQVGNIRIGDRGGEGTMHITGSSCVIDMGPLDMGGRTGKDETRAGNGNLIYTLDAGGASAIHSEIHVNLHSYIASHTTLDVRLGAGVVLDDPDAEIILISNDGELAVMGTFDVFNNGSAAEGEWKDLDPGAGTCWKQITYVGGDGNDVALIPEPATLALLSLGMFIIRRKK